MDNLQLEFNNVLTELNKSVLDQEELTENIIIALLLGGHILIEGPPGVAKTRVIKSISNLVGLSFGRIQFTPDLMPSDLTGTDIFNANQGIFSFQKGPLFKSLILADEINRAPAKVQAALLEAMSEQTISVGNVTHKLPEVFLVMATQNPLESEGTYQLPDAQLDRFLLQVDVKYPSVTTEIKMLEMLEKEQTQQNRKNLEVIDVDKILKAKDAVRKIFVSPQIREYIANIIACTRHGTMWSEDLKNLIGLGASPRATIALEACARAKAWLNQDDHVTPLHVQSIALNVLRHRISLSYEASMHNVTKEDVLNKILNVVAFA